MSEKPEQSEWIVETLSRVKAIGPELRDAIRVRDLAIGLTEDGDHVQPPEEKKP